MYQCVVGPDFTNVNALHTGPLNDVLMAEEGPDQQNPLSLASRRRKKSVKLSLVSLSGCEMAPSQCLFEAALRMDVANSSWRME